MTSTSQESKPWRVSGLYFEACNCDAICPCRRQGDRQGGRSTYGVCDFALGWTVAQGYSGDLALSGLQVVMAGSYDDDEPGSPWRVALYVDDTASSEQHAVLTEIFLGRAGGTVLRNFAAAIGEVYVVRPAQIAIDHTPDRRSLRSGDWIQIIENGPVPSEDPITCGIPGHDQPGQEITAELLRVDDGPLATEVRGRCGFASQFAYESD